MKISSHTLAPLALACAATSALAGPPIFDQGPSQETWRKAAETVARQIRGARREAPKRLSTSLVRPQGQTTAAAGLIFSRGYAVPLPQQAGDSKANIRRNQQIFMARFLAQLDADRGVRTQRVRAEFGFGAVPPALLSSTGKRYPLAETVFVRVFEAARPHDFVGAKPYRSARVLNGVHIGAYTRTQANNHAAAGVPETTGQTAGVFVISPLGPDELPDFIRKVHRGELLLVPDQLRIAPDPAPLTDDFARDPQAKPQGIFGIDGGSPAAFPGALARPMPTGSAGGGGIPAYLQGTVGGPPHLARLARLGPTTPATPQASPQERPAKAARPTSELQVPEGPWRVE